MGLFPTRVAVASKIRKPLNATMGDPCLGAVGQPRDDGVFNEGRPGGDCPTPWIPGSTAAKLQPAACRIGTRRVPQR